jgi:hypothetical protein
MGWSFILGRFRTALAYCTYAINQRRNKFLELHDPGLLIRNDLIQIDQQLVLVREFDLDVDEPFFAHACLL